MHELKLGIKSGAQLIWNTPGTCFILPLYLMPCCNNWEADTLFGVHYLLVNAK